MAVLLTAPRIRFLDSNGAPLAGGKVYTYIAGTTTPQATYTDASGGTPNANPVILDSAGYADIWIVGAYKIVVEDSSGNVISTTDNITGFSTGAVGATFLDGNFEIQNSSDPTKQLVFNLATIASGNTVTIGVPNSNFTLISPSIATTYTAAQRQAIVILADGSTITPDFSLGNNYQIQLTGNHTIANPVNIVAGQSGNLAMYQDATGDRVPTWGWGWISPGGTLPTLSTIAAALDVLKYTVINYNSGAVTISLGSPGVISFTNHGFMLGQQAQITTTGSLPTGLTASTTYYVVPININSFSLATTLANAAANTTIATSGSQSGTHTLTGLTISLTSSTVKSQNDIYNPQSSTYTILPSDNQAIVDFIGSSNTTFTLTSAAILGNGWSCTVRNNGTAAAPLTLTSNSGTVDALSSYVMYAGECRLVQCSGSSFNTVIINDGSAVFTSSGSWTRPPGYTAFQLEIIESGGSGAVRSTTGNAGGGAGGMTFTFTAPASAFVAAGSTETVTVGGVSASVATSNANGAAQNNSGITLNGVGVITSGGSVPTHAALASASAGGLSGQSLLYNGQLLPSFYDGVINSPVGGGVTTGNVAAAGTGASNCGGGGASTSANNTAAAGGIPAYTGAAGTGVGGARGASSGASNGGNGVAPGGGGGGAVEGGASGSGAAGRVTVRGVS